jgi:hypothetical protein
VTPIEIILSTKLKEAEPTLDILGADRKVLQIANQDLTNYVKFLSTEDTTTDALSLYSSKLQNTADSPEVSAFLTVWTGLWLKKWKQRFTILVGQNNHLEVSKKCECTNSENVPTVLDCKDQMIELVALALIKNGEICGTNIVAEEIIKTETKAIQKQNEVKNKELIILNNAFRKARETSQRTGPLVSIKVEKDYYIKN